MRRMMTLGLRGGLHHVQLVEAQIGQLFTAAGLPAAFKWQEGFWVRALCAERCPTDDATR